MENSTYNEQLERKIVEKAISARKPMTDKIYDTVKIKRNGMQISFEFPPKSARADRAGGKGNHFRRTERENT